MLGPVAAALGQQRVIRSVSVHLLSVSAADAHDLLLWQNPAHYQRGELSTFQHINSNTKNKIPRPDIETINLDTKGSAYKAPSCPSILPHPGVYFFSLSKCQ